ncbi:MAG: GTP cyclohydrolase II, partial [Myxococcales bacterium]|nr:GTP cyclohydrolase II [Myxococcales bacterium]
MAAPALRGSLLALGATRRATAHGPFDVAEFRNVATHRSAFALVRGDVRGDAPVLCRVHSSCVTSEFLGACDCDCAGQLEAALAAIDGEGRGVLFYLAQEGRGAGIVAKARDRMIVQASRHRTTTFEAYERMGLHPDARRYGEVADACALLGVEAPLVVLSNNPGKVSALEREKLRVAEMRPLARDASPFNAHYLEAKRASGHVLGTARADAAELPRAVACTTPRPLHGLPDVLHVATYLLPVGGSIDAPVWVELDAFVDLASRAERIALRGG